MDDMGAARHVRTEERLRPPAIFTSDAVRNISTALRAILADVFALYLKTKNFHWHVSGPQFRDYHRMLDEQASQLFGMTDPIAERARKVGGAALHSIGQIAREQRIVDNDSEFVEPHQMLAELRDDNLQLAMAIRQTHAWCSSYEDVGTTSLLEVCLDEAEQRTWFLFETTRKASA